MEDYVYGQPARPVLNCMRRVYHFDFQKIKQINISIIEIIGLWQNLGTHNLE